MENMVSIAFESSFEKSDFQKEKDFQWISNPGFPVDFQPPGRKNEARTV
jgi:hypothetical protein